MVIRPIICKTSLKKLLYIIQNDSKLLLEFPCPINGSPDNNLESPRTLSEVLDYLSLCI
jgi:hypothetical protein